MHLDNFFRINLPYGLKRDGENNWSCFNRAYLPLSHNPNFENKEDVKIHFTKFSGITDTFLIEIAGENFKRDSSGEIIEIWLYGDGNDPFQSKKQQDFDSYFKKLDKLSRLKIKNK